MFRVLNPNWSCPFFFLLSFFLSFFVASETAVWRDKTQEQILSENSHGEIRARVQRRDEIVQSSRHGFESSF